MNRFMVRSASGSASLEFFERTPGDPARPIERFKVRLKDQDLDALARVYTETDADADESSHPAALFALMAAHWRGWPGDLAWESPDGTLSLRSTIDHAGHVTVSVMVRSGPTDHDWSARASLCAEAGQLESLANDAAQFFGEPSRRLAPSTGCGGSAHIHQEWGCETRLSGIESKSS